MKSTGAVLCAYEVVLKHVLDPFLFICDETVSFNNARSKDVDEEE